MALNQVGLERLETQVSKKIGTSKNLIINGAMLVAQRGTSSTSNGYGSVDRFKMSISNVDENPTQAQADVASGTTPYSLGFRKAFKVTNGNQTSGAQVTDVLIFTYNLEAQDIASSGWNYTSSSSDISLSFWVKSSVAQNFFMRVLTNDGTSQQFPMETGSLSADTWTKVTKTIPGNSNLTFDNDNGNGLKIEFVIYRGTNFTGSTTLNQWAANNASVRHPDCTTTWYTTNDATFEVTGVQLEVGSVATEFEHRSFGQELLLCQRYYQRLKVTDGNAGTGILRASNSSAFQQLQSQPQIVKMRAAASGSVISSNSTLVARRLNGSSSDNTCTLSFAGGGADFATVAFRFTVATGTFTNTEPYACWDDGNGAIEIQQDAEL
tara:strand:+ start:12 stop:1151 length:1140 start_codon:yes stop_codon:yes gene_type:complete